MTNCQIGVSLNLVTDTASCPVDWRLARSTPTARRSNLRDSHVGESVPAHPGPLSSHPPAATPVHTDLPKHNLSDVKGLIGHANQPFYVAEITSLDRFVRLHGDPVDVEREKRCGVHVCGADRLGRATCARHSWTR